MHAIAKIEKAEADDALDGTSSAEADAVMVARGDLGVEIGPELVPLRAEADHPEGAGARQAGDYGDADARVDDPSPGAHTAEG